MLEQVRDLLVDHGRVGSRSLIDDKRHARLAIHRRCHRVALRADLDIRHFAQIKERSAFARTENNILELLHGFEGTLVLQGVLVGVLRLLAERTGRGDERLAVDSRCHIVRCQTVLRHHVRLQPDTQGVGVTQIDHLAHTRDTHHTGLDIDVYIVGYKIGVVPAVGRLESSDLQNTVLHLGHRHTGLKDCGWQERLCLRHAVLHVDGGHIRIGALLEINHNGHIAGRGGGGVHIGHIFHAVDLLLEGLDHGFHHSVGVRAAIRCRYLHAGRRNVRILLHRESLQADKADQHDHYRNRARHYVLGNKNIVHILSVFLSRFAQTIIRKRIFSFQLSV